MEHQLSFTRGQPDNEAIKYLQEFEGWALQHDPRGYCVCTSEGKDSRVVGHLMRRAGVKHFYLHNKTTVDPPELVRFKDKMLQEYRDLGYLTYDIKPEMTMVQLIIKNTIPPLRQIRYCCKYLKECRNAEQGNAVISLGVRRAESVSRKKRRSEIEIVEKKETQLFTFDNHPNRRMMENCQPAAERRINPIALWTNEDVWNYSHDVGLEQCGLYQEGFDRLGCIGCPMARERIRRMEFARWPGFKKLYIYAFGRALEERKRRELPIAENTQTPEKWFAWWLSDKAQESVDENQLSL